MKDRSAINAQLRLRARLDPEYRERRNRYSREDRARTRRKVLDHYGARCVRCGYDQEGALTLDHVNDDGADEKAVMKARGRGVVSSTVMYRRAVHLGFPATYQILCANCNLLKLKARWGE